VLRGLELPTEHYQVFVGVPVSLAGSRFVAVAGSMSVALAGPRFFAVAGSMFAVAEPRFVSSVYAVVGSPHGVEVDY